MDGLEVPQPLARQGVDGDDRVREEVVAGAVGAVEVVVGGPQRHVQDAALLVDGEERPGVGAADAAPRAVEPGVVAELPRMGHGVKRPDELARPQIPRAHVARRPLRSRLVGVVDAGEHEVLVHGHPGRDAVVHVREAVHHVRCLQVDVAVVAEPRVRDAGLRVQRDQLALLGAEHDLRGRSVVALPPGQSPHRAARPVQLVLGRVPVAGRRVIPDDVAGLRRQGHHAVVRERQVQDAVDHERGRLARPRRYARLRHLVPPRRHQGRDVAGVDLRQRRVALVAAVPPPGGPVVLRVYRRRGEARQNQQPQEMPRGVMTYRRADGHESRAPGQTCVPPRDCCTEDEHRVPHGGIMRNRPGRPHARPHSRRRHMPGNCPGTAPPASSPPHRTCRDRSRSISGRGCRLTRRDMQ